MNFRYPKKFGIPFTFLYTKRPLFHHRNPALKQRSRYQGIVILVNKTGRIGASVSILLAEKAASYSPLRDIQFCYYTVCATTRECYCYLIFYPAEHSNFLTSRLALWPPNPRELVIASPTWPDLATLGT